MGNNTAASPFDTRLRREAALLLHLKEVTVREIVELYDLDKDEYSNKLYVWKHRAGKRYERLDDTAKELARKEALQRFYGIIGAAARVSQEKALESSTELPEEPTEEPTEEPEQLEGLDEVADFIESASTIEPEVILDPILPENLTQSVSSTPVDLTTVRVKPPETPASYPTPMQGSSGYADILNNVKDNGVKQCSEILKTLQDLTPSIFVTESKIFDNIINRLQELDLTNMKPREIKTVVEAFEKTLVLRRKALILPYGSINPDSKQNVNSSNHLHFHNHGLQSFDPNKH